MKVFLQIALALWVGVSTAGADQSDPFVSAAIDARLISAEDGVAPNAGVISAGLSIRLSDGWKTYWRSPGEVGLPPSIDWSGSQNLANVDFMWPAPTRFRAFGIENFGYEKQVTFPLRVTLKDAGEPAVLAGKVFILICSHICVPEEFTLTLDLPAGTGVDQASATEIATWAAKVPMDGTASEVRALAHVSDDESQLTVEFSDNTRWSGADIFPEMGDGTAFGTPDFRIAADQSRLWARFPILVMGTEPSRLSLTVTTDDAAYTFDTVALADVAPEPPFAVMEPATALSKRLQMILVAVLGGLILNLMPCVLPVLSIKFSSALKMSNRSNGAVRAGFLASAAGTLAFMWILAALVIGLQAFGVSVGWGMQFQNPGFLIALVLVVGLLSANLFGLFEFQLPQAVTTKLARNGGDGYVGDFMTGLFGAVMATPCSAPFLGTALAFALTGDVIDVALVFTAMGAGLAIPYLVMAARPSWIRYLPSPGRWMITLKLILGALLLATLIWLLWVLASVASPVVMGSVVGILGIVLICVIWNGRRGSTLALVIAASTATASFAVPTVLETPVQSDIGSLAWVPFDRGAIPRHVSLGHTVLVDVTADWCLTCKANKALVLDRSPVADMLATDTIIAMQADWTRPDPAIQQFLEANGRFAIPFNIVYGPEAPEGIALSEVLTEASVIDALNKASISP